MKQTDLSRSYQELKAKMHYYFNHSTWLNQTITATNKFELQEQMLNDIYAAYLVDNNLELTNEQQNNLYNIANQCPRTRGKAVLLARALYERIIEPTQFDDSNLCND